MSNVTRIATIAVAMILMEASAQVSARSLYPLTVCGPDLSRLCRLHGAFEATPFHYNLAIYPGCLRPVAVETPRGVRYRRALVCGAPDRPLLW